MQDEAAFGLYRTAHEYGFGCMCSVLDGHFIDDRQFGQYIRNGDFGGSIDYQSKGAVFVVLTHINNGSFKRITQLIGHGN
jgi:hypothetical protein